MKKKDVEPEKEKHTEDADKREDDTTVDRSPTPPPSKKQKQRPIKTSQRPILTPSILQRPPKTAS